MADRPTVTPTKTVNLRQLADELADARLTRNEDTGTIVYTGDAVTQQQLEDAVAAHNAQPTVEDNEETIQTKADQALSDLRAVRDSSGELSNAQLSDAVRLFARVLIAIVRLAIRKLDSTG